ncbi:MAG: hypothetical protein NC117_08975 [Pseudoflavonifractor sp.]|nr:hypothetical protein [Pseudoflavonifractor sp.]
MTKPLYDSISNSLSQLGSTIKSLVKIATQSRRASIKAMAGPDSTMIIMGNGPSLAATIAEHSDILCSYPTMAVNFAALAPEFVSLKPTYYILADPHFFTGSRDGIMGRLHEALSRDVDWPMTLLVPVNATDSARRLTGSNPAITIETFNPVGAEGFDGIIHRAYARNLAMPRPRNVLIPAIMTALALGYKTIHIVGADHSWMRTLNVNAHNEVISVQPHFYKEEEAEKARINNEYRGYALHTIINSFYVAFKAYHDIRRYADRVGASIYNSTPDSFIDAFERRPLPAPRH